MSGVTVTVIYLFKRLRLKGAVYVVFLRTRQHQHARINIDNACVSYNRFYKFFVEPDFVA